VLFIANFKCIGRIYIYRNSKLIKFCFLALSTNFTSMPVSKIYVTCLILVACRTDNPLRLCRVYACIADVLGMMAAGGIRGGPAANISFKKAFALLEVSIIVNA